MVSDLKVRFQKFKRADSFSILLGSVYINCFEKMILTEHDVCRCMILLVFLCINEVRISEFLLPRV